MFRTILRWVLIGASALGTGAVAVLIIAWSWREAPHNCVVGATQPCGRIRWVVAARDDIWPGQELTDRLIDDGLRRTSIDIADIAVRRNLIGQYLHTTSPPMALACSADAAIHAGTILERQMVGPPLWKPAVGSTAAVPVAVDPEFAAGLKPGMRVVFARKVDKAMMWAGASPCPEAGKARQTSYGSGYPVLFRINGSDKSKAIVVVEVPNPELHTNGELLDGTWRPVVVAANPCDAACIPRVKVGHSRRTPVTCIDAQRNGSREKPPSSTPPH